MEVMNLFCLKNKILFLSLACLFGFGACERSASKSPLKARAEYAHKVIPMTAEQILALPQKNKKALTLINFWATWCGPCREEFPDLVKIKRAWDAKGVDLAFVSTDFEADLSDVKTFLAEQGVDFDTYIKQGDDDTFLKTIDPAWPGALPTTFIFDSTGRKLQRWDGPITEEELNKIIEKLLKK